MDTIYKSYQEQYSYVYGAIMAIIMKNGTGRLSSNSGQFTHLIRGSIGKLNKISI